MGQLLPNPTVWIAVTLVYFLYRHVTSCYRFFSDRGIPGPKPTPFIGNVWGIWKRNLPDHGLEMFKKYGNIYGTFEGLSPVIWTNDTKIIRSVFIKDFSNFVNRRNFDVGDMKVLSKMMSIMGPKMERCPCCNNSYFHHWKNQEILKA